MAVPAEVTACTLIVGYWLPDLNLFAWITLFLILLWSINFIGAGAFGEAEFWLSIMKVSVSKSFLD